MGQLGADLGNPFLRRAGDDEGGGAGIGKAVLQGLDPEQQAERHRDGAELVDGDMGRGGLERLRQHQSHPVPLPDPASAEQIGDAVGHPVERAVGDGEGPAAGVDKDDRDPVGLGGCPTLANGARDIEVLRDRPGEGAR